MLLLLASVLLGLIRKDRFLNFYETIITMVPMVARLVFGTAETGQEIVDV
jgi:hypothetical protein